MHGSITAHCNPEKISFKAVLYQKQSLLGENHQPIWSLKYKNLENFISASLTVFEDVGPLCFDNIAQPSMFITAFC